MLPYKCMVSLLVYLIYIKVPLAALYGATQHYLITYKTTEYERIPFTNSQTNGQTR